MEKRLRLERAVPPSSYWLAAQGNLFFSDTPRRSMNGNAPRASTRTGDAATAGNGDDLPPVDRPDRNAG
jgi:hypothetical protein